MNQALKKILLMLSFIAMVVGMQAQNVVVNELQLGLTPTDDVSTTQFKYTFMVTLSDTVNLSKIHVRMDTADGGNHLVDYAFNFDQSTGLPTGYAYARAGKILYITIGQFIDYPVVYAEARIEYPSGAMSAAKKYNTLPE